MQLEQGEPATLDRARQAVPVPQEAQPRKEVEPVLLLVWVRENGHRLGAGDEGGEPRGCDTQATDFAQSRFARSQAGVLQFSLESGVRPGSVSD